jgi:hypothetical protein
MADTFTVWKAERKTGRSGEELLDELDSRVKSRSAAVLEAIDFWLALDDALNGEAPAWDNEIGHRQRRMLINSIVQQALRDD